MLAAARESRRRDPQTAFMIPAAGPEIKAQIEQQLAVLPADERTALGVVEGQMRDVVRQARAAMVCSGTATMETALLKCPHIVVYRAAWPTYWLGRMLIRVRFLGIVNLIAGRELCPEFIQGDAQPEKMADAVERLLGNTPERATQLAGLDAVERALAGPQHVAPAGRVVAEALGA